MSELTATIIQTGLHWEDKKRNISMFEQLFKKVQPISDFVVLPEMFTTGFSMNTSLADTMQSETIEWMQKQSSLLNKPICGSLMISENGIFYNRFVWMNPDGTVQFYNKRHLFSIGNEHNHFASGTHKIIIDFKGWKLLPLICYDLRFPVWMRRTSDVDYDAIVIVANWPQPRLSHWQILLQARAIENQSYVIAANRTGNDGNGMPYPGGSGLINPKGEWVVNCNNQDSVQNMVLHKQEILDWRTTFPVANDADNFILS